MKSVGRLASEVREVQYEIEAPLFPVLPRPLQERLESGLLQALWRWAVSGAMHRDDQMSLSRETGGRI